MAPYQAYDINGYTFYMEERDKSSNYQNYCVTMESYLGEQIKRYYGKIEEIWELDYVGEKLPMFHVRWATTVMREDEYSPPCLCPKPTNPSPRTPPRKMSHGF